MNENEELDIEEYIEEERYKFRHEWWLYLEEWEE